jgi:beta-lactamase class A
MRGVILLLTGVLFATLYLGIPPAATAPVAAIINTPTMPINPMPPTRAPSPTNVPPAPAVPVLTEIAEPVSAPPPPPPTPMPATPVPPAPAPADPGFMALRAELEGMVAGWYGDHAVSVLDLQSGQMISINGTRPQQAACTIKIPILMGVAQDIAAGRYTADAVAGLVQSAMGPSNTPPARELLGIIGGGDIGAGIRRANAIMWDLGASGSIMTHPPGYHWEEYGYAASHGITANLLTTDDLVLILGRLYQGTALPAQETAYTLWSMTIAPDWMNASFGSALPAGVEHYHKVGQLYEPHNTWNDAGIVVFERDGRRYAYALAYLGSYGASWQDAYAHAMSVSEATWRYFSSAPLPPPVPTPVPQPAQAAPPVELIDLTDAATAEASSLLPRAALPDGGSVTYEPMHVLDGDPTTAWVEGVAGPGNGEWLRLSFAEPVTVARLDLDIGRDIDARQFAENNRLRAAQVRFSDGSMLPVTFLDRRGMQSLILRPVTTTMFDITLEAVYSGTHHDVTAIAEVAVWGRPAE